MNKLKIGELYEIEGKVYKLQVTRGEHCTNKKKFNRYYFKKPSFEDALSIKEVKKE